jgi:3-dehydroquinate dehydratase-2
MAERRVLILNGPNLNMLGKREPEIYGATTLAEIEDMCRKVATHLGMAAECRQSNVEGDLVTWIQEAGIAGIPVVLNPGAYSHTSIAIHDAIKAASATVVEVHLSNIHAREPFRHHSHVSAVAKGVICGFGMQGYIMALHGIAATSANN